MDRRFGRLNRRESDPARFRFWHGKATSGSRGTAQQRRDGAVTARRSRCDGLGLSWAARAGRGRAAARIRQTRPLYRFVTKQRNIRYWRRASSRLTGPGGRLSHERVSMRSAAGVGLGGMVLLLTASSGRLQAQTTYPNVKVTGRLQEQFYYFNNKDYAPGVGPESNFFTRRARIEAR